MVLQDIEEINEQDLDNGYIPKDDYRDLVLSICSYIEKLDLFVSNYFSGSTLLQFINLTFNTDSLMFNVQYYYSDIVWEFIPDHSKQDIREGARGLIVSTPTSSAFMFLRGLEGCLRKLCEKLKYPYPTNKLTFGSAIQFLEKYYSERDDDRIIRQISFLRYIKDEFRNPSAHPEKTFTKDEAEQLFQVVNVAIYRIYELYLDCVEHFVVGEE